MKRGSMTLGPVVAGTALFALALLPTVSFGLVVNGYSSAVNDRFSSGYTAPVTSPVANSDPTFVGKGYDWSGVGWLSYDLTGSVALLGPQFFLYANHYYVPPVDSTVQFSPANNVVKSYVVAAAPDGRSGALAGDLAIGKLTAPIPASDGIHYYPILFKGYSGSAYIGLDLLLYGKSARIGTNTVSGTVTASLPNEASATYLEYAFDSTTQGQAHLEVGDSGSPSFIILPGSPGTLYLAGDHAGALDASHDADSMPALYLDKVSTYMALSGCLPYVVTPVTATWTGNAASGDWGTGGNWSGSPTGDTLHPISKKVTTCASLLFDGAHTSQRTITLGADRTVTGIAFASAPGANAFTLAAGNTLTLGEAGLTNNDGDAQQINCPVILRSSQRWDVGPGGLAVAGAVNMGTTAGTLLVVQGAGTATFSGGLTGAAGLSKDGAGTVTLSGTGVNYTGATRVFAGTLTLADTTNFASELTNMANLEFAVTGGTWSLSKTLHSTGTVTKSGAGTLIIGGVQDYGLGAVFDVTGGTLVLNSDAGTSMLATLDLVVTNAEVDFGSDQHLDTLEIGAGGKVVLTGAHVVVVNNLIFDGMSFGALTLMPEPATLALVALGGLVALRRRR